MTVPHITIEQANFLWHWDINLQMTRVNKAIDEYDKMLAERAASNKPTVPYKWEIVNELFPYFTEAQYRAIKQKPVAPTCQVRNLDTGELKTMTREKAKLLQAELGDTVEWYFPDGADFGNHFVAAFKADGIYTYKLKGTVKLTIDDEPAKMLTPAQCEAESLARIDTHDVEVKCVNFDWMSTENQFAIFHRNDISFEFEYRLIRKQPKQPWTGSREDVIALLNALGVTK